MAITACDVPLVNSGCGNFLTMSLKFTILTFHVSRKKRLQPFSFYGGKEWRTLSYLLVVIQLSNIMNYFFFFS